MAWRPQGRPSHRICSFERCRDTLPTKTQSPTSSWMALAFDCTLRWLRSLVRFVLATTATSLCRVTRVAASSSQCDSLH
jgi:hypothetical protein